MVYSLPVAVHAQTALTPRQLEVLTRVRRGLSNREIASDLGISEDGVKTHLSRLFLRYGVSNRISLLDAVGAWTDDGLPAPTGRPNGAPHPGPAALAERAAPALLTLQIQRIHDALQAADLAFEVVAELPPDASQKILDAARKRLTAASAALVEIQRHVEG